MEPRGLDGQKSFKGKLFWAFPNDVVYSRIDVRNGAIGIVPPEMRRIAVSNEYPVYKVSPQIALPLYIKLLFRTEYFRRTINSMISGASGRKRVQPEQLEGIKVPFPPLPIQQAIVRRWEKVQQEIAEIQRQVEKSEAEIPQTVLTELGIPFHPETTLPKVFALPWKDLERWSVNYLARIITGVGDIHKAKCPLTTLGEIARISYGIQKSPANRPGNYARPYLRVANVQRGQLDLSEIKYINVPDSEFETYRLQCGDLLVCEGNSADLVGRPAMWNDEIANCVHQNHILRVRITAPSVLPEFVLEYMQTPPARNYFRARAKFTTNLASINSNDLRELLVPLPQLDLQRRIVGWVKERREEISREREKTRHLSTITKREVEEMILGTRPVPEVNGKVRMSA
ncbi:MAG: restriction endonuclease subunit S [Candidatus Binatia bacterium]